MSAHPAASGSVGTANPDGGAGVLLQQGMDSLRIILNNTFEQRVIFDLRSDLYSHIQMLPLRWFDNRATGDLMTRILEDVNSVEPHVDSTESSRGTAARAAGGWCARDRRMFREIYVTHVCHRKCSGVKSRMNVHSRRRNGEPLVYVIHVYQGFLLEIHIAPLAIKAQTDSSSLPWGKGRNRTSGRPPRELNSVARNSNKMPGSSRA